MKGFIQDIEKATRDNTYFRQVLYTSQHVQVVVMCLQPSEDVGAEVHEIVDQFIRIESGEGKVIIDGVEQVVKDGDAIVIPAGAQHNLINTSSDKVLQLYTVYAPPHHKDGTIHKSKHDAEADHEDHL
jgi:mannose-6-phosphate isomerase-like protein (cupin superfamily)